MASAFPNQHYKLIECEGVIISEYHSTSNKKIDYRLRVRLDDCNAAVPRHVTVQASFFKKSHGDDLVKHMVKRHQKGLFKMYKKGFSYRLVDILGFI